MRRVKVHGFDTKLHIEYQICSFPRFFLQRVPLHDSKSLAQELWVSREPRFDHEAVSLPAPRRFSAPPPGPESCTSARAHRAIVCRRHCSLALASSFLLRTLFPGLYGPECGNTSQLACTQHPSTPTSTPTYTRSTIGDDRAPELAPGTAGKSTVADLGHFGFES